MKNVTPKAGQIWESSNVNKIIDEVTPSRVFYNGDCWESYNGFIIDNIFIPQSDLEWLAVKVESLGPHIKFIARRGSEYLIFESKPKHTPGVYARQQWQNSRYYLGLDEKPQKETKMIDFSTAKVGDPAKAFRELGKVIDNLNKQRETKMIDLSKAEIGDKFIAAGPMFEDIVFELVFICVDEYVFKEGDSLHISDASGVMNGVVTLYKKHEPRWWLKDLPDADIFEGEWLACETYDCEWYLYQGEPKMSGDGTHFGTNGMFALGPLMGIKMPKLTGDEWKLSKISISDLKAWQEQQVK